MTAATVDRTGPAPAQERALAQIVARLEAQIDEIVQAAATAILTEIPAYAANATPAVTRGVHQHVREHVTATLATFRGGEPVAPEDLLFIRRHAAQRAGQISVADFIHAFQVGQRVLWDATVGGAEDEVTRAAALALVGHITRYIEVAVTHAAEVYLETEQLLGATGERVRRDTLEDLLAGVPVAPGSRENALREAGLERDGACLVISAQPVEPIDDVHALRSAAAALARAPRRANVPLTVIRHDEIVIVMPVRTNQVQSVVERLEAAQARLSEHGVRLALGVSTVHPVLAGVPSAYSEALDARALLRGRAGTAALPAMSTFDYLIRHGGRTARRLISVEVGRFLEEDAAQGGTLVATLRAYADADLNAKRAAERLHIHVNTAHYRLAKIEERTGKDLRRVGDVVELLIAAQLGDPN